MLRPGLNRALLAVEEAPLAALARAADRVLVGRPLRRDGRGRLRPRVGTSGEFHDFRDYAPGDDVRNVDWRASGRSRNVQLRRFQDEMVSEWFICLDRSASMRSADGAKWRLSIQLAAAFSILLLRRNDRVGLIAFSDRLDLAVPAGLGHKHKARLMSALAECAPRQTGGDSSLALCAGRIGGGRSLVVLSDFLKPDMMRGGLDRLLGLKGAVHALQILDADDTLAGFNGPGLVEDVESGKRVAVEGGSEPAIRARRRLDALTRNLEAYCRRNGVGFTSCGSGQTWRSVLTRHLSGG